MYTETGGPNMKWGTQILNGGLGTTGPPLRLSTDLFLLYDNTGLLWCDLGLFEITEWEPCM